MDSEDNSNEDVDVNPPDDNSVTKQPPDVLSFQTENPSLQDDTDNDKSTLMEPNVRCKSEPKFFVRFSEEVEHFDMSRSWNESCFVETGYFSQSENSPNEDVLNKNEIPKERFDIKNLNGFGGDSSPPFTDGKQSASNTNIGDHYGDVLTSKNNVNSESLVTDKSESLVTETIMDSPTPVKTMPISHSNGTSATSRPLNSHDNNSAFNIVRVPKVASLPNMKTKLKLPRSPAHLPNNSSNTNGITDDNCNDYNDDDDSDEIMPAPLLVSSSVVELVLLIKRMVHAVKTLCDTVYPLRSVTRPVDDMSDELVTLVKHTLIMRWKLTQVLLEVGYSCILTS